MKFDHHGTVHFGPIHVVDALHVHQVLILVLHHHLPASILSLIQMLVNRYVLKMVLVLLLAAEGQFGALVQLVGVTFSRNIHHDEVLA